MIGMMEMKILEKAVKSLKILSNYDNSPNIMNVMVIHCSKHLKEDILYCYTA